MKLTYLTFSLLHLFRLKIVLLIVTRYRQVNLIEERLNAIDRKNMSQMDIWFECETVKFNKISTLCQILRQTHFQNTTTFHWLLLLPFHSKFSCTWKTWDFLDGRNCYTYSKFYSTVWTKVVWTSTRPTFWCLKYKRCYYCI